MTLPWVPVCGTPKLNCSLMKDFIPLYRILWIGSQCTIPLSTSLNGLCWILNHFCSFGCKYLGKLLHFFQYLKSFPSKLAIMNPLKSMFAVQQIREESFHVIGRTGIHHLFPIVKMFPPIFHSETWMGNPSWDYFKYLVPGKMTDLLTSWLSRFLAPEEEHRWHESTASVCCWVLFLSTFHAKSCGLSQPAPQHWLWFSTG